MGKKYHFAQWPLYTATLWLLKTSLMFLYMRLTVRLIPPCPMFEAADNK